MRAYYNTSISSMIYETCEFPGVRPYARELHPLPIGNQNHCLYANLYSEYWKIAPFLCPSSRGTNSASPVYKLY